MREAACNPKHFPKTTHAVKRRVEQTKSEIVGDRHRNGFVPEEALQEGEVKDAVTHNAVGPEVQRESRHYPERDRSAHAAVSLTISLW